MKRIWPVPYRSLLHTLKMNNKRSARLVQPFIWDMHITAFVFPSLLSIWPSIASGLAKRQQNSCWSLQLPQTYLHLYGQEFIWLLWLSAACCLLPVVSCRRCRCRPPSLTPIPIPSSSQISSNIGLICIACDFSCHASTCRQMDRQTEGRTARRQSVRFSAGRIIISTGIRIIGYLLPGCQSWPVAWPLPLPLFPIVVVGCLSLRTPCAYISDRG